MGPQYVRVLSRERPENPHAFSSRARRAADEEGPASSERVGCVDRCPAGAMQMALEIWKAVIMGVIEGVTEYLPVSSTGHLILTQRALGLPKSDANDAFDIVIQAGAILAVIGLYSARVKSAVLGIFGRDAAGRKLAINLLCAVVPALVIGFLGNKIIDKNMTLVPTVFAWFVGGAAILILSWLKPGEASRLPRLDNTAGLEVEDITPRMAVIIGFAQCIAMWPGTSRSLVTILAALFLGMRLRAAVEFSFLLGVITLTAASAYKAMKYQHELVHDIGPTAIFIGLVTSWIAAAIAIKWLVAYLNKHGLEVFGYYRVALAMVIIVLMMLGYVQN
jgi:undecaprenyl-diphosphatase